MYLADIVVSLIGVYGPPVCAYILCNILVDIVVRAFRGR